MKRSILVIIILFLVLVGGAMVYFKDTPSELWQRGRDYVNAAFGEEDRTESAPEPDLGNSSDPAPIEVTTEVSVEEPEITPSPAPEPLPEPLTWLRNHSRFAPREIILNTRQRINIESDDAEDSWIELLAGSPVRMERLKEDTVIVRFGAYKLEVPIEETNLEELTVDIMEKAIAAAKAEALKPTPRPQVTPQPAYEPLKPQRRNDVYVWNETSNGN